MRDYASLHEVEAAPTREQTMRHFVDAAWGALSGTGVSWLGFYFGPGRSYDGVIARQNEMILGPRRDKPACSPIGLNGACGRAYRDREALIITDVKKLGDEYIACDPRDQSELVIPLLDASGDPYAVLDLDSFDKGAFDESDVAALLPLLLELRLSTLPDGGIDVTTI